MPTAAFSFQGPARFASVPFSLDIVAPVGGVIVSAVNRPAGTIRADWTAATDTNGATFELYCKPDTATGLFDLANIAGMFAGTSGEIATDATGAAFTPGRTYWFGVRAIDRFGNRTGTTSAVSIVANGPDWSTLEALLVAIEQDTRADLPAFVAAGLEALNQSAARRVVFATAAAYELPGAGSYAFQFQLRTYDPDGNPVNALASTLTATAGVATNHNARLSSLDTVSPGVYAGTYTAQAADTPGPLRFDVSVTLPDGVQTIAFFGYVTRAVGVDFTAGDRELLQALAGSCTEPRLAQLDTIGETISAQVAQDISDGNRNWDVAAEALATRGVLSSTEWNALVGLVEAIHSDPAWFAKFVTLDTGETESAPGSVCELSGGSAVASGSDHPLASNQ